MKKLVQILAIVLLLVGAHSAIAGSADNFFGPTVLKPSAVLTAEPGSTVDLSAATGVVIPFVNTVTLTSGTSVASGVLSGTALPASAIPVGKSAYITDFRVAVTTGTSWTNTVGALVIKTSGTSGVVTYATVAQASLTSGAVIMTSGTLSGYTTDFSATTAIPSGKALLVGTTLTSGTVAAVGSPITVTISGIIK